jgi:hypothetical protein
MKNELFSKKRTQISQIFNDGFAHIITDYKRGKIESKRERPFDGGMGAFLP